MKKDFEVSSGNVFADLNLPNAEEVLAKAELVRQIIKKKKLTQEQAALALGIDQNLVPRKKAS
ncbi:XRE family transcriptional regulator [Candidatus Babeliales bacterium]|nr:XRE family transcriptional regulator [Candidatus Babeliales bacterium]